MSNDTNTQPETTQPDNATDSLIRMLDVVDNLPGAAELRSHTYDLLTLIPGQAVVDVGCGAGRAVAEIGDRGMRAVGIDPDPQMIAVARQRWSEHEFRLGTAGELPLDDGSMEGYRADKVFHAVPDPAAAMAEARRALAPGGRIVLIGQDWDTFVIDSDDPELTRTIVHARAGSIPSPRAARRYRNLLLDSEFVDVTIDVRTATFTDGLMVPMLTGFAESACAVGAIDRGQADTWIADQTRRAEVGRLFVAIPLFVAAATRP
ncbi:methyltransferase domain-containing protein [Amycolatopsis sp. NPDC057786]|uniref:methyltransferase domain-containing protein n=1 Tax=Amycolatopsis sp. NPDC057786 TaxID=3346250 RepID=UPI00366FE981